MEDQQLTLDHLKQLQQRYLLLKQQRVQIEEEKNKLSAVTHEQKQAILSVDKQIAEQNTKRGECERMHMIDMVAHINKLKAVEVT